MMERSVNERIKDYLMEKFPLARKRGLNQEDNLLENGVLDSLGVLDLVTFMEKEFEIRVGDEELVPENFQTLDTLCAFVQKKGIESAGKLG